MTSFRDPFADAPPTKEQHDAWVAAHGRSFTEGWELPDLADVIDLDKYRAQQRARRHEGDIA